MAVSVAMIQYVDARTQQLVPITNEPHGIKMDICKRRHEEQGNNEGHKEVQQASRDRELAGPGEHTDACLDLRQLQRSRRELTLPRGLDMTSGRKTFAEDLSPQGPIVPFDVALEAVRVRTTVLSRAIGAVDFFGAWSAADELRKTIAFAARLATMTGLPASAGAIRRLEEVRAVAESMLALAPDPSAQTVAGATSADPHARKEWASYRRRWAASCGATGAASFAASPLGSEHDPLPEPQNHELSALKKDTDERFSR